MPDSRILYAIKAGVARIALATAIHPGLAEEGVVLAVFTRVTGRANRTAAVDQFLAVVEDAVVAVFGIKLSSFKQPVASTSNIIAADARR